MDTEGGEAGASPQGADANVKRLSAPLEPEQALSLRVGDEVHLDGVVWGVRDATLIEMFDHEAVPAIDFSGAVFLHTAPSVKELADGGFEPVSVGTTTSMRMDRFTASCLELGVRAIVGKGGLSPASLGALVAHGGAYLSLVGGAASTETLQIEGIEDVYLLDLMPECLWKFRVRDFGPLFVSMDSTGASSYQAVQRQAEANLERAYRILGL